MLGGFTPRRQCLELSKVTLGSCAAALESPILLILAFLLRLYKLCVRQLNTCVSHEDLSEYFWTHVVCPECRVFYNNITKYTQ